MNTGNIRPVQGGIQTGTHIKAKPDGQLMNISDSFKSSEGKADTPFDLTGAARKLIGTNKSKGVVRKFMPVVAVDRCPQPLMSDDGVIYMGSQGHSFSALDAKTGKLLWDKPVPNYIPYKAGISKDNATLFVSRNSDSMMALDAKTGRKIWDFSSGFDFRLSPPVVTPDGKTVLTCSGYKGFYGIDAKTGKQKWLKDFNIRDGSSPVLSNNGKTVYFGDDFQSIYALDVDTGDQKWEYNLGDLFRCTPAVGHDGTVYSANSDGQIFAIKGDTGEKKWRTKKMEDNALREFGFALNPDGRTVYAATPFLKSGNTYGEVYAFNTKNGKERWKFQADGKTRSVVVSPDGGTVYFGSEDNHLYALDARTGKEKWTYDAGEYVYSPALSKDGSTLYVATSHYEKNQGSVSEMIAVDTKTGKKIDIFKTEGIMDKSKAITGSDDVSVNKEIIDEEMKVVWESDENKDYTIERKGKSIIIGGVELEVKNQD